MASIKFYSDSEKTNQVYPEINPENFIHSRNLFPNVNASGTTDGVSWEIEGNKLTLNGTSTASSYISLCGSNSNEIALFRLKPGTYNLNVSGSTFYDKFSVYIYSRENSNTSAIATLPSTDDDGEKSFSLSKEKPITGIGIQIPSSGKTYTNEVFYLQINEGKTALPYEPFTTNEINIDNEKFADTLKVGVYADSRSRVNVIKSENLFIPFNGTQTYGNTTLTPLYNGSFSIKATTNTLAHDFYSVGDSTNYYPFKIKDGYYSLSGVGSTITKYKLLAEFKQDNGQIKTLSSGSNIYLSQVIGVKLFIRVAADVTFDQIIQPMLNYGSKALPYEPHIPNQIVVDNETFSDTLKVSNEVDGKSRVNIIHSRNLFDKDNAIITNAYFDSKTGALVSGGEGYVTENYTNIDAGTRYIVGNATLSRVVFYNSNKGVIKVKTLDKDKWFATPTNTKYIRIQIMENTSDIIIQKGDSIITPSINVDGEEIYSKANTDIEDITSKLTFATDWSIDGGKLYKQGKHIFGTIQIKTPSSLPASTNSQNVIQLPYTLASVYIMGGFTAAGDKWSMTNGFAYIYIGTNGSFTLTNSSAATFFRVQIDIMEA